MTLQTARLTLLSHSKNMLNASVDQDWDRYSQLESQWLTILENAAENFGSQLDDIGSELMSDNETIQKNVSMAQQELLSLLERESKNTTSIKSYLK